MTSDFARKSLTETMRCAAERHQAAGQFAAAFALLEAMRHMEEGHPSQAWDWLETYDQNPPYPKIAQAEPEPAKVARLDPGRMSK